MSEKMNVSIHGHDSDIEFEHDPKIHDHHLLIKAMVYVDITKAQSFNAEIGVTLSNNDIDELVELLQKMKT
jgi:hypothetical protein